VLCGTLLFLNIYRLQRTHIIVRFLKNLFIGAIAYGLFIAACVISRLRVDCFTGNILHQFSIAVLICTVIGHLRSLRLEERQRVQEMEQLKIENLQNRVDALASQINPHFFFNSLNILAALVRNEEKNLPLEYIAKLSSVFRYVLQSDKKGMVTLADELEFVEAFSYLQKIRYLDKLSFTIDVPEQKKSLKLPVVSLLPLIENVVKHNVIDSENEMQVSLSLNADDELVVSNPVHEKLDKPEKSGIGLSNLVNRFELLAGKAVRIVQDNRNFTVYLPLKDA
jgi:LytS/YehU family sensor histidine kinase